MTQKNAFQSILKDLEIEFDDMMDPDGATDFIERVVKKAKELEEQLDKKNSIVDVETDFKKVSYRDADARRQAAVVYNQILDLILEQDAATIANLVNLFPDIVGIANGQLRTEALRTSGQEVLTKKHLHEMYISLKAGYDAYIGFMKLMYAESIPKNPPMIKSKSGNYSTGSSGMKVYVIIIDDEVVQNPFRAAKELGLEITHYMDVVEIVQNSDGYIRGKKVQALEVR